MKIAISLLSAGFLAIALSFRPVVSAAGSPGWDAKARPRTSTRDRRGGEAGRVPRAITTRCACRATPRCRTRSRVPRSMPV